MGYGRNLLPETEVDKIISCAPIESCQCGGTIVKVIDIKRRHQKNILSYLTDAVKSYVCKTKAPSLLINLTAQQEPELQLAA